MTAAAVAVVSLLAGCGDTARPVITVTPRDGLVDSPLRIKAAGASQGAVARATATDAEGGRHQFTTPTAAAKREPWRPRPPHPGQDILHAAAVVIANRRLTGVVPPPINFLT